MPDKNGEELISSGDPRVDAALARLRERNDARFKDLEDALLVQIHLEQKQAAVQDTRLRDTELVQRLHQNALVRHQESPEIHEQAVQRHEEFLAHHEIVMREVEDKLNALLDREMRREGGPEAV